MKKTVTKFLAVVMAMTLIFSIIPATEISATNLYWLTPSDDDFDDDSSDEILEGEDEEYDEDDSEYYDSVDEYDEDEEEDDELYQVNSYDSSKMTYSLSAAPQSNDSEGYFESTSADGRFRVTVGENEVGQGLLYVDGSQEPLEIALRLVAKEIYFDYNDTAYMVGFDNLVYIYNYIYQKDDDRVIWYPIQGAVSLVLDNNVVTGYRDSNGSSYASISIEQLESILTSNTQNSEEQERLEKEQREREEQERLEKEQREREEQERLEKEQKQIEEQKRLEEEQKQIEEQKRLEEEQQRQIEEQKLLKEDQRLEEEINRNQNTTNQSITYQNDEVEDNLRENYGEDDEDEDSDEKNSDEEVTTTKTKTKTTTTKTKTKTTTTTSTTKKVSKVNSKFKRKKGKLTFIYINKNGKKVKKALLSKKKTKKVVASGVDTNNTAWARFSNGYLKVWNYNLQKNDSKIIWVVVTKSCSGIVKVKTSSGNKVKGYYVSGSKQMKSILTKAQIKKLIAAKKNASTKTTKTTKATKTKNNYKAVIGNNGTRFGLVKDNGKGREVDFFEREKSTLYYKGIEAVNVKTGSYNAKGNIIFLKKNGDLYSIKQGTIKKVRRLRNVSSIIYSKKNLARYAVLNDGTKIKISKF